MSQSPSTSKSQESLHRLLLGLICFLAGAGIMIIEISANRLLSPVFGNSSFTWTALIGVVLVAFSIGGFAGGSMADKFPRVDLLGWLLGGSAITTLLIPPLHHWVAPGLSSAGVIAGPVTISLILFTIPGILLGAVSPASVRFYSLLNGDANVGKSAGTISMLGSLGSFVGTFLCGFYLLSVFSINTIFMGMGALLLAMALIAFWMAKSSLKHPAILVVGSILAALILNNSKAPETENSIFQANSYYHQIEVIETESPAGQIRYLKLDSTTEGGMRVSDGALILDYQHFWQLARLNSNLDIQRALFIGAGAFGMPEHVSKNFPSAHVDVAEIDPEVIEVGKKFFKLSEFPNVKAHGVDARRFLNSSEGKYDLIFGDAYNGVRYIPPHLITQEFFKEIHTKLSSKGVFMMNVISAVQGPQAELLSHMLPTIQSVFPHVEVFAVSGDLNLSQNLIVFASKESWSQEFENQYFTPNSLQSKMISCRVAKKNFPTPKALLTDNWNPVDAIIARQLLN